MSPRTRIALGASIAVDVVAGVVLAVAGVRIVAFALIAVGLVAATAWAFYEVGASEDRDRARGGS
jgi:hypothetical protein